jgi:hypothetical protein
LPDPTFEDQASWSNTYGGSKALFKTVTDAKAGRYVMYITAGEVARNATWYPGAGTSTIPIDISKKYRLTFYYRTINGTSGSNSYATLQQRDSTGAFAVGNGGHGFYVWARSAINTPDWTKVEAIVGAGTSYTFAANTKYVAPSFLLNWESTGAEIQISDVRFEEVVNSTLIEDGAITTDKVGANQITGGKIYAGTLEADRIRGNSLQTNSIDASKIQAGAVLAEKLAVVTFGDSALLNSGFEEPLSTDSTLPAKWTRNNVWGGNSATVYRDLSIYRSGSAGLTLFPGAGASADIRAESIPLVPGDIWYMSFWARSSGTNAATSPGFYARVRGGSTSTAINVELYAGIENTAVPIAWTKYEVNFTIPEGVTWGSPLFLNYQTNTGHAIHIDDVQFKKIITGTIIQNGAITTDKMTANTINGDRIAGNTLSGNKIIAGSIQTDRLFVTGRGAALNADPNCSDRSSWFGGNIIGISDGPGTTTSVVNTTGSYAEVQSDIIPIDINKNYRLEIYAKALAGTGTGYLGIIWYNSAQEYIPSGGVPGWENGSYSYYGRVNQAFPSTWTRYATSFGPDETRKVPGNAKYARIVALLNYSQTAGTQHGITNVRLMEKAGADLIVDGAITASKINADGISANSLTSGTIAADRIATGSITTGKIGAGEVKANNIGADQVNASHLQISNDSATDANGIFMDGTNKVILIRNAGITRVKLGFLG